MSNVVATGRRMKGSEMELTAYLVLHSLTPLTPRTRPKATHSLG
jgi:hypothetical protein